MVIGTGCLRVTIRVLSNMYVYTRARVEKWPIANVYYTRAHLGTV